MEAPWVPAYESAEAANFENEKGKTDHDLESLIEAEGASMGDISSRDHSDAGGSVRSMSGITRNKSGNSVTYQVSPAKRSTQW